MLDFSHLQTQFARFSKERVREEDRHARRLERGLAVYDGCHDDWERHRDYVAEARTTYLAARLLEAPAQTYVCGERPTPITVAAADGSQVYPDRHIDPPCYLLNVSSIAFHYGTLERPRMQAVPELRYRRRDLEHVLDNLADALTANIVSAIRDVKELEVLLATVREERREGRPVVALADGTLIRWMLSSLNRPALEKRLMQQYVQCLETFFEEGVPLCSYISRPASTEVVNFLRVVSGDDDVPEEERLTGLRDRHLFEQLLEPCERSVVFESSSRIQDEYAEASGPHNRICFFYLCVPTRYTSEIARVEVPRWVVEHPGALDLVHAVVLDQTEKGRGYPVILSEAHEQAVIRASEKEMFYRLLERHLSAAGVRTDATRKQLSKDVPLL